MSMHTLMGGAALNKVRPMRTERMVVLRSSMPVQLVTLRHAVPMHLGEADPVDLAELNADLEALGSDSLTTPKVDSARAVETTAGKGGEAR